MSHTCMCEKACSSCWYISLFKNTDWARLGSTANKGKHRLRSQGKEQRNCFLFVCIMKTHHAEQADIFVPTSSPAFRAQFILSSGLHSQLSIWPTIQSFEKTVSDRGTKFLTQLHRRFHRLAWLNLPALPFLYRKAKFCSKFREQKWESDRRTRITERETWVVPGKFLVRQLSEQHLTG